MYKERQERIQQAILAEAVRIAPQTGWGPHMLSDASIAAGYPAQMAQLIFMDGAAGILELLHQMLDAQMLLELQSLDLLSMKVSERVFKALELRFQLAEQYRDALVAGTTFLLLPHNAGFVSRILWHTVDAVWSATIAHDDNFAYYTKRLTLAGAYSATVAYWVTDGSAKRHNTMEFLQRRINDVLRIGNTIRKIKAACG